MLEGRVYVDATGWKNEFGTSFFSRFYCDKAEWQAGNYVLLLSGTPIAESQRHVQAAISADTTMKLYERGKLETFGPAKTDVGKGRGWPHETD
jgi:hypothetical protein